MKTIYAETVDMVSQGSRFMVELEDRSLRIDGRYVIRRGEVQGDWKECELIEKPHKDPLSLLEELHRQYIYSVPSERSQSVSRKYFRALPEHELDMEDIMFGELREVARCRLELALLCFIMKGWLTWEILSKGDEKMWFWQSEQTRPAMVILKKWIVKQ